MNKKMAEGDLIYLYCVTNKIPKLKPFDKSSGFYPERSRGIKEAEGLIDELSFVYHQGLYAIVTKVKENEFGEENLKKNLADFEWIKVRASLHEKLIEGIMKYTCVVPFKFATLFNSKDNLKAMLKGHAQMFKENLKNLKDKKEWGVKIYCDIEKLKIALNQEDNKILKIDKEISSSSPGKAFILKKKKEELLNAVLNAKLNEYGQKSFGRLKEQSTESKINKLLPKEVTERKDDMILNSAFLIEKDKVSDFMRELYTLKAQYKDSGLFFDCTGPWPPYNFCETQTYGAKRT